MQKITPFLWFENNAEEAMNYYLSIFPNSRVDHVTVTGEANTKFMKFALENMEFYALDGGPYFKITPAISLFVHCKDQAEVDHYWEKLLDGGEAMQCGWLTDKFGVTWQIVPIELMELMGDPDREKAQRVMQAMMQMVKIDIAGLRAAAEAK